MQARAKLGGPEWTSGVAPRELRGRGGCRCLFKVTWDCLADEVCIAARRDRFRGLVGHDFSLTPRRSPVRARAKPRLDFCRHGSQ